MSAAYTPLGLLAGDRLEPSPELRNIDGIFAEYASDVLCTFWRPSRATLVVHRCPLWDVALGISAPRSIGIDLLHTFYLGALNSWVQASTWTLLDSNLWGSSCATQEDKQTVSISLFKHDLFAFYQRYDHQHRDSNISRLAAVTPGMLGMGRSASRRFKAKAMETFGVALYLIEALEKYSDHVGFMGHECFVAGKLILRFIDRLKEIDVNFGVEETQELLDIWKNFMSAAEGINCWKPKAHLMYHAILRARRQGSPLAYQVFLDESLNRELKLCLKNCHQRNFETLGLVKMADVLKRPSMRRRRC